MHPITRSTAKITSFLVLVVLMSFSSLTENDRLNDPPTGCSIHSMVLS